MVCRIVQCKILNALKIEVPFVGSIVSIGTPVRNPVIDLQAIKIQASKHVLTRVGCHLYSYRFRHLSMIISAHDYQLPVN